MSNHRGVRSLTRRDLLARGTLFGAALVVGPEFIVHSKEAWAAEVAHLKPRTFATLVQMARDIYPHDRIPDAPYAAAVKAHDTADGAAAIEEGVAGLDQMARDAGHPGYAETGWEADRVAMLRQIETSPFFQSVRGGLVVGLYNNQEVWGHFGYEGESYSQGGYIDRGFNDIAWL